MQQVGIFSHGLKNIPKYARQAKYSLTNEIFSNMRNNLFSVNFACNKLFSFLTLMRRRLLKSYVLKHVNPDSGRKYIF